MLRTLPALLLLPLIAAACAAPAELDELGEPAASSSPVAYDQNGRAYTATYELLARERLRQRAEDEQLWHDIMTRVYVDYRPDVAERIRQQIVAGDFSWAPRVELVDGDVLGGAAGAYAAETGVVYLNELLPDRIQRTMVYLEEIGHHLDVLLKDHDTPGDEGGLFRLLVFGAPFSADDEAALRAEDDRGTIVYDGRTIEVEYFFLFDWLEKAWEGIVDAWEWATPRVFWAFVDQLVIAYDAAKTVAGSVSEGLGAFQLGLQQLADGNFSAGLKNIFEGAVALSIKPAASLVITIVLHEIAAVQTLIFGPGRELTPDEKTDARVVFGDRWWIDVVRVVESKTEAGVFGAAHDDPFTLEFTIYLKDRDATRWLMTHELTHVFQFVNGDGTYKLMSVYDRLTDGDEMYRWRPAADEGRLFPQLMVEQQASFVEDSFMAGCFENDPWQQCYIGTINRTALFNSAASSIRSGIWFDGILPPALITTVL